MKDCERRKILNFESQISNPFFFFAEQTQQTVSATYAWHVACMLDDTEFQSKRATAVLAHLRPRWHRAKGAPRCGAHCRPPPSRLDLLVLPRSFLLCRSATVAPTGNSKKSQKLNAIFQFRQVFLLYVLTDEPVASSRWGCSPHSEGLTKQCSAVPLRLASFQ